MQNFIALSWNKENDEALDAAEKISHKLLRKTSKWEKSYENKGLIVFSTKTNLPKRFEKYLLKETKKGCKNGLTSGGIILGKIFKTKYVETYKPGDPPPPDIKINDSEKKKIIESEGKYLINNYWGKYIAFFHSNSKNKNYALSDPTGGMPCYYAKTTEIDIYFSDIEDYEKLFKHNISINWNYISERILNHIIQTPETGIKGVTKLMPGECRITSDKICEKNFYWNPINIAKDTYTENIKSAAKEIRRVTMACINAWASCYNNIILRLSGGLDSAIILSCLSKANPSLTITCLNYFHKNSDERILARLAAKPTGARLIEIEPTASKISIEKLNKIPRTPKISDYHYGVYFSEIEKKLLVKTNSEAIFCGHSGDELFYNSHQRLSAVDYSEDNGLFRPGTIKECMNAALISRTSIWSVFKILYKNKYIKKIDPFETHQGKKINEIIEKRVKDSYNFKNTLHPLLKNIHNLPPGKISHIASLLSPHMERDAAAPDNYIEEEAPLYSQPLIELCLKLPTYVLSAGGKSRGLARMAFYHDIPKAISARESKGSGTGFHNAAFKESKDLIKKTLSNGMLCEKNLISKNNLEKSIDGDLTNIQVNMPIIKSYFSIEIWLQKWKNITPTNGTTLVKSPKPAFTSPIKTEEFSRKNEIT